MHNMQLHTAPIISVQHAVCHRLLLIHIKINFYCIISRMCTKGKTNARNKQLNKDLATESLPVIQTWYFFQ